MHKCIVINIIFSEVYKAQNKTDKSIVAVKKILTDRETEGVS